MSKNVKMISLTKNEIVIKYKKKKINYLTISSIGCTFIILLLIFLCHFNESFSKKVLTVYNPVNSLYSDNSDIVFTSSVITFDKLEFTIPIVGGSIEIFDNSLQFTIGNSIMIRSIESGVVVDSGQTMEGIKYIKIKHTNNVFSIIENVDIIGVSEFESVKRGQDIATGINGDIVTLKIFKDDIQVPIIKVSQSKIICQE